MKKHILGAAIFSFIVVATIIFTVFNVTDIPQISAPQYLPSERTNCELKRKASQTNINPPSIAQAVYNVKTKTLTWKLNSLDSSNPTVIYWFLKDEKGIQRIDGFYANEISGKEIVNPSSELDKDLSKLSGKTNFYLMSDTKWEYRISDEIKRPLAFDSNRAFSVTIDYGK